MTILIWRLLSILSVMLFVVGIIVINVTGVAKNKFYNDCSDLTSKSRSISAKQIQQITPALKQKERQKDINLGVNKAVQEILLNKDTTQNILNKLVETIQ